MVLIKSPCLQLNYNEFCNLMNSRSRRKEEEKKEEVKLKKEVAFEGLNAEGKSRK